MWEKEHQTTSILSFIETHNILGTVGVQTFYSYWLKLKYQKLPKVYKLLLKS